MWKIQQSISLSRETYMMCRFLVIYRGFFLHKVLHRDAEINDKDLRMGLLTAGLLLLMLLVSNSGRDERAKRGRCCWFFFFTTLHMTGGNFSNMFPVQPGRVCTACDAIRWAKSSHSQEDAPVCEGVPSDYSRFFVLTFHKAAGQIWKYSCSWAKESTPNFLSGR